MAERRAAVLSYAAGAAVAHGASPLALRDALLVCFASNLVERRKEWFTFGIEENTVFIK